MSNNNQIDNTSYYALPCGRQLEDYLWLKRFPFWLGSCLKYRFRAGHKDGESVQKDIRKADHYVAYAAAHDRCYRTEDQWDAIVDGFIDEMLAWDGDDKNIAPFDWEW